ncbi:SH3 domain-binding glutamic acid-rich protein-like protein, partial [Leptotrombidium deliense]
MVIKVYLSGISASKEVNLNYLTFTLKFLQKVKTRQQRALLLLDTLKVKYESIDITEPGHEEDRQMIKEKCNKRDGSVPLPPQFFNDDEYCGDWFDFEIASDHDRVLAFLKLEDEKQSTENIEGEVKSNADVQLNGEKEDKTESVESKREINESQSSNEQESKPSDEAELDSEKQTEDTAIEKCDSTDVPMKSNNEEIKSENTANEKSDADVELSSTNENQSDAAMADDSLKDEKAESDADLNKDKEQ